MAKTAPLRGVDTRVKENFGQHDKAPVFRQTGFNIVPNAWHRPKLTLEYAFMTKSMVIGLTASVFHDDDFYACVLQITQAIACRSHQDLGFPFADSGAESQHYLECKFPTPFPFLDLSMRQPIFSCDVEVDISFSALCKLGFSFCKLCPFFACFAS